MPHDDGPCTLLSALVARYVHVARHLDVVRDAVLDPGHRRLMPNRCRHKVLAQVMPNALHLAMLLVLLCVGAGQNHEARSDGLTCLRRS